uniref:CAZy families GH36 protein n=1 Tax=uncultured Streptococcus sp. TaxID=83427 RepID=A0A060CG29_9STRE|nr:CAZy families GH36 protein [uncultured Streptococcus sp.]
MHFSIQYEDGSFVSQFTYDRYEQFSGTVNLEGLPQARAREGEAETLIVYLVENTRQLELQLQYTIFKDFPILSRCVRVKNRA